MSCIIRLSEPLLKLRSRKELIETLLHEMIHAFNFVRGIMEINGGHGPKFQEKMREINLLAGTNITVYHTFHDEVELYRKHWWRCDGICKTQKPYFGFVKRTSNRAPGPNDFWWKNHLQSCGGKFIKVQEPEKPKKKSKSQRPTKSVKNTNLMAGTITRDIVSYFPPEISTIKSPDSASDADLSLNDSTRSLPKGSINTVSASNTPGRKLGGTSNGRSRLLDMFEAKNIEVKTELEGASCSKRPKVGEKEIKPELVRKSMKIEIMDEFEDAGDIILIDDEYDDSVLGGIKIKYEPKQKIQDMCNCPVCNEKIEADKINAHLDECLTMQMLTENP